MTFEDEGQNAGRRPGEDLGEAHDVGARDAGEHDAAAYEGDESQDGGGRGAAQPRDEVDELREQLGQTEDQLLRAKADLANFKRRQLQESQASQRAALEGVMNDLVQVLDVFGHALQAYDAVTAEDRTPSVEALVEGVRMTETMLVGSLERHGLERIDALGKPFDPTQHESAGFDPDAPRDAEDGTVTKVTRAGYRFRGQVLRASRVLVAGSADTAGSGTAGEGRQD